MIFVSFEVLQEHYDIITTCRNIWMAICAIESDADFAKFCNGDIIIAYNFYVPNSREYQDVKSGSI